MNTKNMYSLEKECSIMESVIIFLSPWGELLTPVGYDMKTGQSVITLTQTSCGLLSRSRSQFHW